MKTEEVHIGGRKKLAPNEIMILEANTNYTDLYLLDGKKITVATTLKKLEERFLDFHNFFRSHKSYIVNLDYLSDYQDNSNVFTMQNNKKILISRRRKMAFQEMIST
jgi:two-component system LytT family response regulator